MSNLTERTDLAMLAVQGPEVKDKIRRFIARSRQKLFQI